MEALPGKPWCWRRISSLTSLSIDLHAAARHIRASTASHPQWHAELPRGLCNLPKLTELDLSFRAFQQPELHIPQVGVCKMRLMRAQQTFRCRSVHAAMSITFQTMARCMRSLAFGVKKHAEH